MNYLGYIAGALLVCAPLTASAATTYLSSPTGSIAMTGASGSDTIFDNYNAQDFAEGSVGNRYGFYYELTNNSGNTYEVTVSSTLTDVLSVNMGVSFGSPFGYNGANSSTEKTLFTLGNYNTTGSGTANDTTSPALSLISLDGSTYYLTVEFVQFKEGYVDFDISWVTTPTPAVPLPAALPLLVAALGGIGVVARKRRAEG